MKFSHKGKKNPSAANPEVTLQVAGDTTEPQKKSSLVRPNPELMALEQRFMFDGAAVADAIATIDADTSEFGVQGELFADLMATAVFAQVDENKAVPNVTSAAEKDLSVVDANVVNNGQPEHLTVVGMERVINEVAREQWDAAIEHVNRLLSQLPDHPDYLLMLQDVFGGAGADTDEFADNVAALSSLLGKDGLNITLEFRSDADLKGAMAAYAAIGHTGAERIYINADWVNMGFGSDFVSKVLLEEVGHALDQRLNSGRDSLGDEGQLFVGRLTGADIGRADFATDNDRTVLDIEGQLIAVEMATDNDAAPTLAINDVAVNEAAGTATFTVTRSGATGAAASVNYATSNDSAIAGSDYIAANGTLNFAAGETTKTITITILNDDVYEAAVEFHVTLSNAIGASISNATGFGVVWDDGTGSGGSDNDMPTLSVSSPTVTEGGYAVFTVSLSKPSMVPIGFTPSLIAGTAALGTDTAAANTLEVSNDGGNTWLGVNRRDHNGTVSFVPDNDDPMLLSTVTTLHLRIATTDDSLAEGSENFTLSTGFMHNGEVTNIRGTSGTATITDNDAASTLAINDVTVNEAAGTATFTVTRSGATGVAASVDYATSNNSAIAGSDYIAANGTLSFAPGETTKTITITILNDEVFELAVEFNITLSNAIGTSISDATGVGVIWDDGTGSGGSDNDMPTLSVSSPTVAEGGYAVFTVSLSKPSMVPIGFTPSLIAGTATLGTDTAAANTLEVSNDGGNTWRGVNTDAVSFVPDQDPVLLSTVTTLHLRIATTDDSLAEGSENFTLSTGFMHNGEVTNIRGTSGTATITDNNAAPTLAINDVTVNEAAGTATFTVTRSGATGAAASVDYATSNDSASAGADYTAANGTLSFAAGETTKTFTISILNDEVYEGSEVFNVTLSNANGASLSDASGVGTIKDDGAGSGGSDNDTPTLSVSSPTVSEGNYAVFTVSLSKVSTTAVSFTPSLIAGTATLGTDTAAANTLEVSTDAGSTWSTVTGAVSIAAGQSSVQLRLATSTDTLHEGSESFSLSTGTLSGALTNTGAASGTVTITDNNAAPTLAINDVTVNEAAGTATFTVTRSGATGAAASVDYATSNDSASAGADYTAANGTLSFAAGETTKTFTISILNDEVYEGSEVFNVTLSNANGASLSDASGVGTIKDDGAGSGGSDNDTPTLSVSSPTVSEGNYAVFTVSLSKVSTTAVSFTPSLIAGTATLGTDTAAANTLEVSTDAGSTWSTVTGAVSIAAGQSSVQLRLATSTDTLHEGSESFSLSTGTLSGALTNTGAASGTVTITDNNAASVRSVSSQSVTEGTSSVFTVAVVNSSTAQSYSLALAGVSASLRADFTDSMEFSSGVTYEANTGTVKVPAGVTSFTVSVPTIDDSIAESSEIFTLTVGGQQGTATISDNNNAGVKISETAVITSESGSSAGFAVVLDSQPTADVSVIVSGLDATEGRLSANSVIFTASNWNVPQTITVTGVDDFVVDGDIRYTLQLTASSADSSYAGRSASVVITNQDNDKAGFTLAGSNLITSESGTSSNFTVKLDAQPTGTVTINLSGNDATEGSWNTQALVFTADNWNSAQTVAVTGRDDSLFDGDIKYVLTLTSSSSDANFNGRTATLDITNLDNDKSGITLSDTALITSETGSSDSFTVQLQSQPTSTVTFVISGLDATEGSLSTSTLTFTPENWNTAQAVTVTGINDVLNDGDIGYSLTLKASSADAVYQDMTTTLSVINQHNDQPTVSVLSPVVNESSPFAVFNVTGRSGQRVTLSLDGGTATADVDFGPGLEISNGSGWVLYSPGSQVALDNNGRLLVRTAIRQDSVFEGSENFGLTAINLNGVRSTGLATLRDDGVGDVFRNDLGGTIDPSAVKDDDRALRVSSPVVNEASPFAVFRVGGEPNQVVTVAASEGTATATDFGPGLQVYNGTSWVAYTPGSPVSLNASGVLLVRTAIINDQIFEGGETFTVSVTNTGGISSTGIATIKDDGTGVKFNGDVGADGIAVTSSLSLDVDLLPPVIRNVLEQAPPDPTPDDLLTVIGKDQVVTLTGEPAATAIKLYNFLTNEPVNTPFVTTEGPAGTYTLNFTGQTLAVGQYAFTITKFGFESKLSGSFTVDSTPGLYDVTSARRVVSVEVGGATEGLTRGRVGGLDQDRNPTFWDGAGWSVPVDNSEWVGPNGQWRDSDGEIIRFSFDKLMTFDRAVIPNGEQVTSTLANGSKLTINTRTGAYTYDPAPAATLDVWTLYASDGDKGSRLTLTFDATDTLDRDGIPANVESRLADLVIASESGNNTNRLAGDLNNDGIRDAEQNALATLAWENFENFEAGLDGVLTELNSIISISVRTHEREVDVSAQLTEVRVINHTDDHGAVGGSRPVGLSSPWDAFQFAIEPLKSVGLLDVDPSRPGTQQLIYIDISRSGIREGQFDGYMKFIGQSTIDAYSSIGGLIDLNGSVITQPGWYDYTQKVEGGDGAKFVITNGFITRIDIVVTDNSFGDNDPRVNRVFDPGMPVGRLPPTPPVEEPVVPPVDERQVVDFKWRFDATRLNLHRDLSSFDDLEEDLLPRRAQEFDSALQPVQAMMTVDQSEFTEPVKSSLDPLQQLSGLAMHLQIFDDQPWQPVAIPGLVSALEVLRGMPDQFVGLLQGSRAFEVPRDAFIKGSSESKVTLSAHMSNGEPLPAWISFDSRHAVFTIGDSDQPHSSVQLRLTASDQHGRESSTVFRIHAAEVHSVDAARASLTERLTAAARYSQSGVVLAGSHMAIASVRGN